MFHIPLKVYSPYRYFFPASNIHQMWQRSLSNAVKDAGYPVAQNSGRKLEKKAKVPGVKWFF